MLNTKLIQSQSIIARPNLNVKEGALYIGISQRKLRELLAEGVIRKIRIGSRVIIRRKDIDEYLEGLAS